MNPADSPSSPASPGGLCDGSPYIGELCSAHLDSLRSCPARERSGDGDRFLPAGIFPNAGPADMYPSTGPAGISPRACSACTSPSACLAGISSSASPTGISRSGDLAGISCSANPA
ncbi:hypothetical protein E1301_Tti003324 [Triplophysa tibetana]|uniref:Uncharacterized protein n=1 Tax=Triplophysa tibetana TaxID=1572043 RepID=A0A5A9PR78_9TELE|nr:hypothetical protein E1301_Tti003324 [Triplophysa tibetana]